MNQRETLFDIGEPLSLSEPRRALAPDALVQRAARDQYEMPVMTLDDRVAKDHPVRAIEAVVYGLDLSLVEAKIESNAVTGGRPAVDPKILLTLWIWGVSQGESEASVIASRTKTDDVYRWICGGVSVGERTVRAFRKTSLPLLMSVFGEVVGALMSEGLIDLFRIAQDGSRVRASAGADSFRRAPTLESLVESARAHLHEVLTTPRDPARSRAERAALERGARERTERVERALARAKALAEGKSEETLADKKKAPRASTSDPEATRMKMPDGGYRPAYNVQFATVTDGTGAIVGVTATDRGNDRGELGPMLDRIEKTTGVRPREALVDGGFVKQEDIEAIEKTGTKVFAPAPKVKADPNGRTAKERSPEIAKFYERIESDDGKAIYSGRGEVAELANAHAKSRFGMTLMVMRGLAGATVIAMLVAITNNVKVLIRERESRAATSASARTVVSPAPSLGS